MLHKPTVLFSTIKYKTGIKRVSVRAIKREIGSTTHIGLQIKRLLMVIPQEVRAQLLANDNKINFHG